MDWFYLLARTYLQTLSQETKDALQKYNVEAIRKFKSSRNLHETNFVHDLHEDTQSNSPSSKEDDEFQECQAYNTDQGLEPPTDDLLDFMSSQEPSDDQIDQVLQTYQTYQESQSKVKLLLDNLIHMSHIMLLKQTETEQNRVL